MFSKCYFGFEFETTELIKGSICYPVHFPEKFTNDRVNIRTCYINNIKIEEEKHYFSSFKKVLVILMFHLFILGYNIASYTDVHDRS